MNENQKKQNVTQGIDVCFANGRKANLLVVFQRAKYIVWFFVMSREYFKAKLITILCGG
jgi:hypothetical protein